MYEEVGWLFYLIAPNILCLFSWDVLVKWTTKQWLLLCQIKWILKYTPIVSWRNNNNQFGFIYSSLGQFIPMFSFILCTYIYVGKCVKENLKKMLIKMYVDIMSFIGKLTYIVFCIKRKLHWLLDGVWFSSFFPLYLTIKTLLCKREYYMSKSFNVFSMLNSCSIYRIS